ncbi:MAG: Flp family type IVb pilin [Pseudomonadota bacterium]
MFKFLRNLRKDERGATAIEYGLIAALVSIAAIGAMTAMGGQLTAAFTEVQGEIAGGIAAGQQAPAANN